MHLLSISKLISVFIYVNSKQAMFMPCLSCNTLCNCSQSHASQAPCGWRPVGAAVRRNRRLLFEGAKCTSRYLHALANSL